MVLGDRSSAGGGAAFDFNSQAGVLSILQEVRASTIPVSERNELRDLIFVYANGGGDQTVRNQLEDRLLKLGITSVTAQSVTKNDTTKPNFGFAGGRPTPVFSTAAPVKVAVGDISRSEVSVPPVPTPSPLPPIEAGQPVIKVVVPASVPGTPQANITSQTPVDLDNKSVYLDRIRVIKADVNQKVGNPVNLVEMDNVIGREYMSALLEAMKVLGGGQGSGIRAAMDRLENIYTKVQELVAAAIAKPVTQSTPETVPVPLVGSTTPIKVSSVPIIETVSNVIPVPPLTPSVPVQTQVPIRPSLPVTPIQAPIIPEVVTPVISKIQVVTPVVETVVDATPTPQVVPITSTRLSMIPSVADALPLRTPEDLPTADSLKEISMMGDPLYTSEVDSGLEQLLSEWPLFNKSGLFGTGPHGHEHPLFLKLAPLSIPLLLSGRFEGATQEIKQSITDYMNGWRYEQGIIYDKDESFEKYLRRVIRHIIDWQKSKV